MNIFEYLSYNFIDYIGNILVQIIIIQMEIIMTKSIMRHEKKVFTMSKRNVYLTIIITIFMIIGCQCIILNKGNTLMLCVWDTFGIYFLLYYAWHIKFKDIVIISVCTLIIMFISLFGLPFQIEYWKKDSIIQTVMILFCVYIILNAILKRDSFTFNWKEMVIILGSGFISMLSIVYLIISYNKTDYKMGSMICAIGVIVNYLILLSLIIQVKERQKNEIEYMQIARDYDFQKRYMQSVFEIEDCSKRIRHDMKNNMNTLSILLNEGNEGIVQAKKFLEQYMQSISVIQYCVKTNNKVVDAVINSKISYCSEHSIKTSVTIDQNIKRLSDVELCNILGNLIDNAIEAELKCPIDERFILINIEMYEEVLAIVIKNRICGSVFLKNKDLSTRKKDKENHGYGITNVKNIVKKYDGFMDIYEDEEYFYCNIRI